MQAQANVTPQRTTAICVGVMAAQHFLAALELAGAVLGLRIPVFLPGWTGIFNRHNYADAYERTQAGIYGIFVLLGVAFCLRVAAEKLLKGSKTAWLVTFFATTMFSLASLPVFINRQFWNSLHNLDGISFAYLVGMIVFGMLPIWAALLALTFSIPSFFDIHD